MSTWCAVLCGLLRPSDAYMHQPGRRQAIIWSNAGILSIGPLGTNFSEIVIKIHWKNAFENVFCEKATILSGPQCVKWYVYPCRSGLIHWYWNNHTSEVTLKDVGNPSCYLNPTKHTKSQIIYIYNSCNSFIPIILLFSTSPPLPPPLWSHGMGEWTQSQVIRDHYDMAQCLHGPHGMGTSGDQGPISI